MSPSITERVWLVYLWLIPALPLVASFLILSLAGSRRRTASSLAISGQVLTLMLSILAFIRTLHYSRSTMNFRWFTFGSQDLNIGFILDPLAAAMMLMITFVGLCIFIFSTGYMGGDKNFSRFFAYLSFFSGAMLGVVIANSLLLLFVSWELVGLASYLLIGFWIERPSAAAAAKKAFITTRIGDLGFFIGLLWLYHRGGTLLFYDNGRGCLESAALLALTPVATYIALLIFCGAVGKSGQFPLHVWLPDAMEGPTPVSALIHAATMVAAGVFLVARVYPVFQVGAISGVSSSLTVVVWIGVITALLGSLIAIAQFDIKRILAYSTVSQLGLMMVSLGVGGVAAGILHLLAHGFFKALLFLGAGSVLHGLHHEQDIRRMGGLRKTMPVTFLTYAVGMMALSGVPLLFAGAWTKEEILHATSHWPVSPIPYYLMLAGVALTAFYMMRQVIYIFLGSPRRSSERAHESPSVMIVPLLILATSTILLSVVLSSAWPWLHGYLTGEQSVHLDVRNIFQPMIFISLALVSAGFLFGWLVYRRAGADDPLEKSQPALFRFLANRMWLDELYSCTIIAFVKLAALLSDWLDRYLWDGLVRLVGRAGQGFGVLTKGFDEGGINAAVDDATLAARSLSRVSSLAHSGQVQVYLAAIAIGMLALLAIFSWLI